MQSQPGRLRLSPGQARSVCTHTLTLKMNSRFKISPQELSSHSKQQAEDPPHHHHRDFC